MTTGELTVVVSGATALLGAVGALVVLVMKTRADIARSAALTQAQIAEQTAMTQAKITLNAGDAALSAAERANTSHEALLERLDRIEAMLEEIHKPGGS